jgi:hypothetical protein
VNVTFFVWLQMLKLSTSSIQLTRAKAPRPAPTSTRCEVKGAKLRRPAVYLSSRHRVASKERLVTGLNDGSYAS